MSSARAGGLRYHGVETISDMCGMWSSGLCYHFPHGSKVQEGDYFGLKSIKPDNPELIIKPLNRVNSGG